MFPGSVFLSPQFNQDLLHRVVTCHHGLTLDQGVPLLAQRYRGSAVSNRMVELDIAAEFLASNKAVVERFATQVAGLGTKEIAVHCRLFSDDPLLERVEAKTEGPMGIRKKCGHLSRNGISVEKLSHETGRHGKGV
jgi:hypothetical protein